MAYELMDNQTFATNSIDFATTTSTNVNASSFRTIGVAFGIFDIIVGTIGNLLTILAIAGNKKLHKPFHIFIANLCIIDFLTASTMMPFNVTAYYTQAWPFGEDDFTCTFMAYSYYCCGYTSIVCLLVITVNRFVGVVYPDEYEHLFTHKRIVFVIAISWLFAPTFLAPIFFFGGGGYGWNPKQTLCVFLKDQYTTPQKNYMQFIRVLFQFLPLVVMISLYTKIFRTSRRSRRAVTRLSIKSHSGFTRGRFPRGASQSSPTPNRYLTSGHVTANPIETTSLQSITHEPLDDVPCANDVRVAAALTAQPSAHPDELSLQIGDLAGDGKARKKSHLSRLLSGKSISVPSSPALDRKKISESATSSSSLLPLRSLLNFTKNSQGSRHSNSNSKLSLAPATRSRCSSKGNKYTTIIKMEEKKRKRIDRRLLRISVTICAAFTVLFLPSVIVNLIPVTFDPKVHMFASFITWLNSCVNPIIYSFMNANMRSQYKSLLIKFWNATCRCLKIEDHSRRVVSHKSFLASSTSVRSRREVNV